MRSWPQQYCSRGLRQPTTGSIEVTGLNGSTITSTFWPWWPRCPATRFLRLGWTQEEVASRIDTVTAPTIDIIEAEITIENIGGEVSASTIGTMTAAVTEPPATFGASGIAGAMIVTSGATLTKDDTIVTIDMTADVATDVISVATSATIVTRNA